MSRQDPSDDPCRDCGLCCMRIWFPPFGLGETARLPAGLRAELEAFQQSPRAAYLSSGDSESPCVWLDLATGSCRHHEHRPDVCRRYPVDGESCREVRGLVGLSVRGGAVAAENRVGDAAPPLSETIRGEAAAAAP